jgi:hypothetical protein
MKAIQRLEVGAGVTTFIAILLLYLNRNTQHWHTVFLDQYMAKACKGCIPRKLSTLQVYQCPVLRFSRNRTGNYIGCR